MTLPLNAHGEIIDINEADQFQPAKSQFMCGYYACAMARSMAPVGAPPTLSVAQIISDAEGWYRAFDGTDAITNTNGMTLAQLYNLLQQIGLHYQATATDVGTVKDWTQAGYPVIIAITEGSVHDLALGDNNPYPWTPAGTHIILVTGALANGNLLVRDSANCTDLYNPNSLRPGPRTYDAGKLQLVSATVVVPPWMPRPTSATPPAPLTAPPATSGVPVGWKDENGVLTAPNGIPVVKGFRDHVLTNHWDGSNWPLEAERGTDQLEASNPSLGKGVQQTFRWSLLGYTVARGVFEEWTGQELLFTRGQVAKYYTFAIQMRDYAAKLETDLQAFQTALPQQ